MCRACEPAVDMFRGFLNLCPAGDKLTFGKRPEADVLEVLLKPFSHLRYWKGRFFYIQNTVVPSDYPTLLLKGNSVAERMESQRCRTIGSTKVPTKQKLDVSSPPPRVTRQKSSSILSKAKVESFNLTISDDEAEGLRAITPMDYNLLHVVVDNIVNRRARELLRTMEQVNDFDKNHVVIVLRQKIVSLLSEVKDHQGNLEKMLLESQKWARYKETLAALESKVVALEGEKARAEVVSKVLSYIAMEFMHNDEMGQLVSRLATFAIFYGRCIALEEVPKMKDPLDLAKVLNPSAPVDVLLYKNPHSLRRPTPSKTSAPSKLVNPSPAPSSKLVSPPS
ncbi:hypothetical protein Tco_1503918 [Tanacetum coccineum]